MNSNENRKNSNVMIFVNRILTVELMDPMQLKEKSSNDTGGFKVSRETRVLLGIYLPLNCKCLKLEKVTCLL